MEENSIDRKQSETSERISLWCCIHDADFLSIQSDLLDRTITVVFRVFYINEFHQLPEDTSFRIKLENVRSVSAMRHTPWTGAHEIPSDLPWQEQEQIRRSLYGKGRLESMSWQEADGMIRSSDDMEMMDGGYIESASGIRSLELAVWFQDPGKEDYIYLRFEYERAAVVKPDESQLQLSEFLALGEAYWESWNEQNKSNAST